MGRRSILVAAFILLVALTYLMHTNQSRQLIKSINGEMDLTDWDFTEKGTVNLSGEWHFFWKQLLTPPELAGNNSFINVQVPKKWNGQNNNGKELDPFGYATYGLTINIDDPDQIYALNIPPIRSAFTLWVDDQQIVSKGTVGTSFSEMIPKFYNSVVFFKPDSNKIQITIQVSNFEYLISGITREITLGNAAQIKSLRESNLRISVIVCAVLLFFGIYLLRVYSLQKILRSSLYFGLFCFVMAFRAVALGEHFLIEVFPGIPWWLQYKLVYISFYLTVPLFVKYLAHVYPEESIHKISQITVYIALGYIMLTALFPYKVYHPFLTVMLIYTIGICFYMYYVFISAFINKRTGATIGIIGFTIMFYAIVNDMLRIYEIVPVYLAPVSVLFFSFSQVLLLAEKFTEAFRLVEKQAVILKENNEELERLDSIKDEFLANTSHELRTPLHGIIGIAENLSEKAGSIKPDFIRDNLDSIITSAKKLSLLINDILDAAKLKHRDIQLDTKPVDLYKITDVVLHVLNPMIRKKPLEMTNSIDPEIPHVMADENRLQQILRNIIENAIKFTEKGLIDVSASMNNRYVEIAISDTGTGIPKNEQTAIFKSYNQGTGSGLGDSGGTGIGLSITKKLIELHGGVIRVKSVEGKGTVFTFLLPVSKVKPVIVIPTALTMPESTGTRIDDDNKSFGTGGATGKPTILVVDDDPMNIQVVSNFLDSENCTIIELQSGQDVLDHISINGKPDLLLLDVMMPGMDGFEVCTRIRKQYSKFEVPIIFLTARNQITDIVEGFSAGGNDYLTKPFSKNELLARVQNQIDSTKFKKRLISLRDFANKASALKDTDSLIDNIFNFVSEENNIISICVFFDACVKQNYGQTEELKQEYEKWNHVDEVVHSKEGLFIFLRVKEIENYVIGIQYKHSINTFDLEYFKNLINQAELIRRNIRDIIVAPDILHDLYKISENQKKINFIKSEDGTVLLYLGRRKNGIVLQTRLKKIKMYYDDSALLQVHRSYLINPDKVKSIHKELVGAKKNSKYSIIMDGHKITIGKSYIPKIKERYPHWFKEL